MATPSMRSYYIAVLVSCFSVIAARDTCWTRQDVTGNSTIECSYGCCGHVPRQHCCHVSLSVSLSVAFGTLGVLCLLVYIALRFRRRGYRDSEVYLLSSGKQQPYQYHTVPKEA